MSKIKNAARLAALSKEEELNLGILIQRYYKALDEIESGEEISDERKVELEETLKIGKEAVDKMVRANLGLVYARARAFKAKFPSAPDLEDLEQDGMAGMMTAIKKYDPSRGNKFSTVATYWIYQAIARETNKTGRLVRLPENRINDYMKINKVTTSSKVNGLTPKEVDKLIMDELHLSQKDLINIRSAASIPASLNKVIGNENGTPREFIEFVSDNRSTPSSEDSAMKEEMFSLLENTVSSLPEVHRDVIFSSFSIGMNKPLTQREVQAKHRINATGFRQIQNEAFDTLRDKLTKNGLHISDFFNE